jgi:putative membrane protein insertion efficiency factor
MMEAFSASLRNLAHFLIRAYQISFSAILGGQCRFLPTCSDFMDQAIAKHGIWAGGWLGIFRLCRCHPWGGHGFDPVPEVLPPNMHWLPSWTRGQWLRRPIKRK